MHNYLRAVGFSNIVSRTDFDNRLEQVLAQVEIHDKIELDEDLTFAELHWECSDNMGIIWGLQSEENMIRIRSFMLNTTIHIVSQI